MKTIFRGIGHLFSGIYHIFDRLIVTPLSRLIFNINEFLKSHNLKLDYIFNRPNFMIYLSLILAVIVFLLIDSRVITLVESEAEVITNVPVKANYNDEAYVVEGIPESVDIVLIGRKSDIYLAKQLGTNSVILDLSDYEARDSAYKVYLSYTKSIDSINYKLDPSYVSVTVKNKVSVSKTLDYDLINEQYLSEELSVEDVSLSKTEVVVKGSQDAIDNIASLKALIDLKNDNLKGTGTFNIDNVTIAPYDSKGNLLDNVEIIPSNLTASVTLNTYSKSLPIKVLTTGNLVTGKSIASILINNNNNYSLTAYGDEEVIDTLEDIPVTINIDGEGASTKTYPVTISKPTGVRSLSDKNVNITVTFGDEKQKELNVTTFRHDNLGSNLTANIVGTSGVPIIVKGVQSVIDSVSESNIDAYIDLEGYTAGEYDVQVKVKNDDPKLNYVVSSSIKVRITENKS